MIRDPGPVLAGQAQLRLGSTQVDVSASPAPPVRFADRLPSYSTLAYVEKLAIVVLLAVAGLYLLVRGLRAGPLAAGREIVRGRV